ncbi:alpha-1,2-fucosyltransferase [Pedobacter puniceum]|uniref:Alpha-1,2-fucosyltransferase n=1 Tax=Pedobacter puniceum TaxID=2666136 RepID=A0A7K0FU38_9SPHI|nr:alpha-1,2-fucosyltransferase [Pedobacter puniceum]MRX48657.1 alpha-1,2-fucosyltransferase [Pedobacter puniceum]
MDLVVLINGLGNQMSQYAFYLQKREINKSTRLLIFCNEHNGFELNKAFNLNINSSLKERALYIIFRLLITEKYKLIFAPIKNVLSLLGCKIIRENYDYTFKKEFLKQAPGINYYFGGWHSEKYFENITNQLFKSFQFNVPQDELNKKYIQSIKQNNSIAIHIRRGDFLNKDNINLFGGVCTQAYYQKAIDMMETKFEDAHFFVFSNDLDWSKSNLRFKNATFIGNNIGSNSWKDMFLMSICKHNIIANSTFSWWGAWLNRNENKTVICPDRFLLTDTSNTIYPESWIKINTTQP